MLSESEAGAWLISHSSPAAPVFAEASYKVQMTPVEMPKSFQAEAKELTEALRTRMNLIEPRKKQPPRKKDFDWAIRNYYFSAKRHSLRDTYELLILEVPCKRSRRQGGILP